MKLDKKNKVRLDVLMVQRKLAPSRERARSIIMSGNVLVDNSQVDKPGTLIKESARVLVNKDDNPYVSRGGLKLEKALADIPLDVSGKICLDVGASTGGFTDCLLQRGALKVYAVDVGYGQFHWDLRQDPRTFVIERTNIRYMPYEKIGEKMDIITVDTSFISLKTVVPAVEKFMKPETEIVALIKPQFEAGKEKLARGGVVRDESVRQDVVNDLKNFFKGRGYYVGTTLPSPLLGPKGNKEYIISLKKV